MTISRKWILNLFRAEAASERAFESCMEYMRNDYLVHAADAYALYQATQKACLYAVRRVMSLTV